MCRKKGQSILEYVIVLTVVVVAIAAAAKTHIADAVDQALSDAASAITTATGNLLSKF